MAHEEQKSALRRLAELFVTPLSMLLLVLATVSYLTGETKGAVVIAIMVVLATLLSFIQEYRSSKAAERLRAMVSTTATVLRMDRRKGVPDDVNRYFEVELRLRGPTREEMPIERLVPGDVVLLSAGDMVPADVRLLAAKDLFVNEAALTGEAMPVEKFARERPTPRKSALELPNICFMGTNVVSGTATALVVATGAEDLLRLRRLQHRRPAAPADQLRPRHQRFIWLMIRFILVMVPLVFLINGFTKGDWMEAFLFAVAVAVGLTPEMLPMIVTINLAKGAIAMSRKKVIVKRLNSIQNFGAMDVLCTDKTGTLTQDKVILERHVDIFGEESERVLEYAYLNSYYQSGLKNLLDVAVLEHVEVHDAAAAEHALRQDRRSAVRLPAPAHVGGGRGGRRHARPDLQGAVEEIFSVCTRAERHGEVVALEPSTFAELQASARAQRGRFPRHRGRLQGGAAGAIDLRRLPTRSDLILVGYIAFLDPPKESAARGALRVLREHGVAVKILTGDNEIVTRKVCRDVGLTVDASSSAPSSRAGVDEELAEPVGAHHRVRQAVAAAEGAGDQGAASQGPRGRLPRRRHQRRPGAQGR